MNAKRITMSLATIAAVSLIGVHASKAQGLAIEAASGHPYNNTPISNYSISDGYVTWNYPYAWIIPISVPIQGGTFSAGAAAFEGTLNIYVQAWSFKYDGSIYSGIGLNEGGGDGKRWSGNITVPANGTMFIKTMGHSAGARPTAYAGYRYN